MKNEESLEKQILSIIKGYYNNSQRAAIMWYNKPHRLLSDKQETPKEMVESGRGKEVLNWIQTVLR